MPDGAFDELLGRSHRLGADKRITNFAGGNTSAKLVLPDPVTGAPVRVLAVKGSGGDLGTLTESGLALLELDRVQALEPRHAAGTHEDDIVAAYSACRFGEGGAVPSIDTPLHALVDLDHVDHLHPDSMIALATATDGEHLVLECFGSEVGWLPWRRPGFELGLEVRDFREAHPDAVGAVLGCHGMICWAATSDDCEATSLRLIERAEEFLRTRGEHEPFGAPVEAMLALPDAPRAAEAARLAPVVRGLASTDQPRVAHFSDAPVVLEFLASESAARLAHLGTKKEGLDPGDAHGRSCSLVMPREQSTDGAPSARSPPPRPSPARFSLCALRRASIGRRPAEPCGPAVAPIGRSQTEAA